MDAKAKLLPKLQDALKIAVQMRRAQNTYWRTKFNKQQLLIEAKRLEAAFDMRLAELIREGVFDRGKDNGGKDAGETKLSS